MEYSCKITPKSITLIISIIVHILILLVIISTFYFLYVSEVAKKSFKNEIKHAVDDNMIPSIKKSDTSGQFKKILKDSNLEILKEHFKTETDVTKLQNEWLVKANYGVLLGTLLLLLVTIFILYFSCGKVSPYNTIMLENIILFSLIAVVELVFFLYIGSKFIPTKPSLIMKTFVESVEKNLH